MDKQVTVIGGGLAGSECALQLARRGISVTLYEMRPQVQSPAHTTDMLAELVCSNSFKSQKPDSAAGLLKWELQLMGSELLRIAQECSVAAGNALAVDRDRFSAAVTHAIEDNPRIDLVRQEATSIPDAYAVIAAGPLCSEALFSALQDKLGTHALSFFDAVAPIVDAETINYDVAFSQSRHAKDEPGDYLNCPFTKEQYELFWNELVGAELALKRSFESQDLFQACQPVEEVARTGIDSLRFGALKPVGLLNPVTNQRPWAVVQLRAENAHRSAYNLVGFQTNLTWSEQKRVFRLIPGLEQAEFFRFGVMHRNSFVDSPHVLDSHFTIPDTHVRLAGQITGTEGYVEAIASGLFAALNTFCDMRQLKMPHLPKTSAFGSLVAHATDPQTQNWQPEHVNFGLMPPLGGKRLSKRDRYAAYAERAHKDMLEFCTLRSDLFGVAATEEQDHSTNRGGAQ